MKKKQPVHPRLYTQFEICDNMIELYYFDNNFDSVWEISREFNSFIAVRNSEYLKQLYSNKRFVNKKY